MMIKMIKRPGHQGAMLPLALCMWPFSASNKGQSREQCTSFFLLPVTHLRSPGTSLTAQSQLVPCV